MVYRTPFRYPKERSFLRRNIEKLVTSLRRCQASPASYYKTLCRLYHSATTRVMLGKKKPKSGWTKELNKAKHSLNRARRNKNTLRTTIKELRANYKKLLRERERVQSRKLKKELRADRTGKVM